VSINNTAQLNHIIILCVTYRELFLRWTLTLFPTNMLLLNLEGEMSRQCKITPLSKGCWQNTGRPIYKLNITYHILDIYTSF